MTAVNENEVEIGQTIYVFASSGLAKSFEACLAHGTIAACKLEFPPIAIYPPAPAAK